MKRTSTPQTIRDRMHVAAFRSIFKAHPDLKPEVRLAYAIVATSDEALEGKGQEALIQQWVRTYGEDNTSLYAQDDPSVPWPGEH